jgi:hypothetical protein
MDAISRFENLFSWQSQCTAAYWPAPPEPEIDLTGTGLTPDEFLRAVREGIAEGFAAHSKTLAAIQRKAQAFAEGRRIIAEMVRRVAAARRPKATASQQKTVCGCGCTAAARTASAAEVLIGKACKGLSPSQCQHRMDRILANAEARLRAEGRCHS